MSTDHPPGSVTRAEGVLPMPPLTGHSTAAHLRPRVEDMTTSTRTLNNGITMPALGFGAYQTPSEQTVAAVEAALETGYRHIDTAVVYGNERQVGEAVRRSGLARDEVFLETEIRITDFTPSSEQLTAIDALDTGVRGGPEPADITRENFGIEIPDP